MPAYQHEKHFTLDEAPALIPWLTEKAGKIISIFTELDDRGFDIASGKWTPKGNGHSSGPPPDEYREIIGLIAELDQAGVLVKNFRMGAVDIPYIRKNGEEVYLCWMHGESTINYWHRTDENCSDRRKIS